MDFSDYCNCFLCKNCIKDKNSKTGYSCAIKKDGSNKHNVEVDNQPGICCVSFEEAEHLELLKNPNLFWLIDRELEKRIVNETDARRTIFLVFNMRNVKNLGSAGDNLLVNDDSGMGKDHITSSVFKIIPQKEGMSRRRISPKVLGYLNNDKINPNGWHKKALYLEDVSNVVFNDDVFKVMTSARGVTRIDVMEKTQLKHIVIRGKPSIVITSASATPNPEMLRRFPICNLDSSEKQTVAILKRQAELAETCEDISYSTEIIKALSSLNQVKVRVPFAVDLLKIFPTTKPIVRTHFRRFIDYIKSSAALYQFQREQEDGYIIANEQDYEIGRIALVKTTSNQYMLPITKEQQAIIDVFKENKLLYTVKELEPIITSMSERTLRRNLDKLVHYGFLSKTYEQHPDYKNKIMFYRYNDIFTLNIPKTLEEVRKRD